MAEQPESVSESVRPEGETQSPKAKKPGKAPEKPFIEAIQEDLIPGTQAALQARGILDLELKFENRILSGQFNQGRRFFEILFAEETLPGAKFFSCASDGVPPSTIESFMIDERKPDVSLIVFYIVQRLYAQKWF
jgi:hypothetical protein